MKPVTLPCCQCLHLGHNFAPAHIHAGGIALIRQAGTIVGQLMIDNYMEAVDIPQIESFEAGILFAQTEGIMPGLESAHAIASGPYVKQKLPKKKVLKPSFSICPVMDLWIWLPTTSL